MGRIYSTLYLSPSAMNCFPSILSEGGVCIQMEGPEDDDTERAMFPSRYQNPFNEGVEASDEDEDVDANEGNDTAPDTSMFSDLVFIPPSSGRRSNGATMPSQAPITCYEVQKETEASKCYWDNIDGPFFNHPTSDTLRSTGLFGENPSDGNRQIVVPLGDVVKHVVATVRIANSNTKTKRRITLKNLEYIHEDAGSGSGTKKRVRSTAEDGHPAKKRRMNQGAQDACTSKTIRSAHSSDEFYNHRIMKQKILPITVRHGNTSFSLPLASLVLDIAEKMCYFEGANTHPIAINRYSPSLLQPLINYAFPPFALAHTVAKCINDDTDTPNPFTHPQENYYGPVVKHVREIICNNDPVAYTALEMWLAEILFNPTTKYPVCPIISGPPGVGKNYFIDFILKYVIGGDISASVGGLDRVTGDFNGILANRVMVLINEDDLNKNKKTTNLLKTMCSDVLQCIERKYVDAEANHPMWARFIILTNNDDPFKLISKTERRFVVINTTNKVPSHKYFEDLESRMLHKDNAPVTALHYVGFLSELRKRTFPCDGIQDEMGCIMDNCRIPHRLMHPGPDGYNPRKILRKPINTKYYTERVTERISNLHFFLYAFVVKKKTIRSILPLEVTSDEALSQQIPLHQDLGNLMKISPRYLYACYNLYMQHCVPKSGKAAARYGMTINTSTSGSGFNPMSMKECKDFNRALETFLGDHNDATQDPPIPGDTEHEKRLSRRNPKAVVYRKMDEVFGTPDAMLYNLSGIDKAFRTQYEDCYDYLNCMYNEVVAMEGPMENGKSVEGESHLPQYSFSSSWTAEGYDTNV